MTRFHHAQRSGRHKRPKSRAPRAALGIRDDFESPPVAYWRAPVGFDLAARCPRLALAHRQRRAQLEEARLARMKARRTHQDALRLVAHRELQLVRASDTRDARYIRQRQALLVEARMLLAGAELHMAKVGA